MALDVWGTARQQHSQKTSSVYRCFILHYIHCMKLLIAGKPVSVQPCLASGGAVLGGAQQRIQSGVVEGVHEGCAVIGERGFHQLAFSFLEIDDFFFDGTGGD